MYSFLCAPDRDAMECDDDGTVAGIVAATTALSSPPSATLSWQNRGSFMSALGEHATVSWPSSTSLLSEHSVMWQPHGARASFPHSVIGPYCSMNQAPLHEKAAHLTPQVRIGQTYTLTAEETEQSVRIGRERNSKNVQQQTKNMNFSQRNDDEISIQGVVGELAFSRLFGLPIEIHDTTCRNAHNDTFDATLPNGWKVDVKTTVRNDAPIIVSTWKRVRPPQLYALLILENYEDRHKIGPNRLPRISFRGFVHSSVILQESNLKTMRNGYTHYHWPQDRLQTLDAILENSAVIGSSGSSTQAR